ncbi:MAG: response regulator [Desulfuromonadales bacterium]|nr:response regulator [Desulfuromonadales bacterium]NIR33144.1 response regulator [Desulfuromonadales bacterium]NIS41928.1 response regulator [Desulfuromonadales bacterium]
MKKILIVDDQVDIRKLLEIVLRSEEREFIFARDGEECIDLAKQHQPDLILLDIMMPGGIDGCETARQLRRNEALKGCPILAMTAKMQKKDQAEVIEAGADECLVKPFDISLLQEKVARMLDG